jgi:Na+:H+ antiporter, NhaA family
MQTNSEGTSQLKQFIDHEATGGIVLGIAALFAVLLVNFGLSDAYHDLLAQRVRVGIGALALDKSLHHFINDGLMAVFFFLVGLEIKREILEGSLSSTSQIILPAAAALGGIIVPSSFYAWFNWDNPATLSGWAIPAATDIAFALGVLALVGKRVPLSLKIFLLTLATFDDLAAIVIIAVFYTSQLSVLALVGASLCIVALGICNRADVERTGPYILLGLVLWVCVLKSGVHATLAGVALGLLIPMRRQSNSSPVIELEHTIHPYVKWLVLPLFAFANAGLQLDSLTLSFLAQPIPAGIIAGLFLGKPIGIMLVVFAFVKLGLAKLPEGATWRDIFGVSCLAGIGFTMSLFIGSLAFVDSEFESQVRIGVVVASASSILLGLLVLLPRRI